ncbi:hypothetical protein EDD37DRAFT_73633 [Exophiala viscosa]|uniref:uncharacterized protein n=1 Tax=Exophiala viscosa TaxID=2486360 RepID=UPI00218D939F|nr:hypothetical protein EDD37DRAFT_73633 [Exophiala viscosa]
MAILGTFEAQVIVNGVPAAEYDDDEEPVTNGPTLITKYVEAVSDALFAFKVKISPTYKFTNEDGLAVYAYIDGHSEGGRISRRQDLKTATPALVVDGHLQTENGRFKNCMFKFADLETRDLEKGDDTSMFKEKYSELGTLRVEIWRARITGEAEPTRYEAKKNEVVPEKALKGRPLDVVTSYAPVDVPMENTVLVKLMDSKHLAKFIFKYRTRRALQSLMIIERSPTPLPLEERPVEELTREEMAELLRRQNSSESSKNTPV